MGFQPTICKSAVTLQNSCPKLEPQDSVDEKYEHAQQENAEEGRYRRKHGLHNHSHACVNDKSELHLFPSSEAYQGQRSTFAEVARHGMYGAQRHYLQMESMRHICHKWLP